MSATKGWTRGGLWVFGAAGSAALVALACTEEVPAWGDTRCGANQVEFWQGLAWVPIFDCPGGCDREGRDCFGATPTLAPPIDEAPYYAVLLDDSRVFVKSEGNDPCLLAEGPHKMPGADIDAVEVFAGGRLVGRLDVVDYRRGKVCGLGSSANEMTNELEARGAPDATLETGFVSLEGGWLIGELDDQAPIRRGYSIIVYEVGTRCGMNLDCGGLDEGFEVFVALDLDCVNQRGGYPYASCALKITGSASGVASIPVSGF